MQISQNGKVLLEYFEGLKLKPYLCSAKVPTIGVGSTYYEDGTKVTLKDKAITKERAYSLMNITLKTYEDRVKSKIKATLNQGQYDSLVCLCYNLGSIPDSLANIINKNPNDKTIWGTFLLYDKVKADKDGIDNDGDGIIDEAGESKEVLGLVRRRNSEAHLYFLNKLNYYSQLK